ncbi:MAG: beta-N-acetylhexosaminidase [Prevotella sp.]|nr:beta-N-acetylhexosaminidase [Prevotella sp.]
MNMRQIKILLLLCMVSVYTFADNRANFNIVPLPDKIQTTDGKVFILQDGVTVGCKENDENMLRNVRFLSEYVKEQTGITLNNQAVNKKATILLCLNEKVSNKEGYRLTVNNKKILIEGSTPAGVFYGIQTLRKTLPITKEAASIEIPAVVIDDAPRFAYRGMHLDVSRHFFPLRFVKQYIDMMVLHNMNTFHWHITDDQGWRIEIKKYPELTKKGSIRQRTVVGRNTELFDYTPYGGYFTQEEAKEIVRYAAERYIKVIPEIDMPGHMLAALHAYPELGCTGGPYEVCPLWGVFDDILCAGNPKVYDFVKGVLDEICEIFPSEIVHIGGDEAPRTRWQQCAKCQEMIRKQGLKADAKYPAEAKLQGYFTSVVEDYLASKGKRILGWDEILEGDVRPSAMIMSWRGVEGGIEASAKGHDVVMAPTSHLYFDYYQVEMNRRFREPQLIGGTLPIDKTYSFEPIPAGMSDEAKSHILGVQANLWTEYITCDEVVEYQVLPRMGALCEVQWMQPEKKNFDQFVERSRHMTDIYQHYGWQYAKHLYRKSEVNEW